jgi:hypothetical protein
MRGRQMLLRVLCIMGKRPPVPGGGVLGQFVLVRWRRAALPERVQLRGATVMLLIIIVHLIFSLLRGPRCSLVRKVLIGIGLYVQLLARLL